MGAGTAPRWLRSDLLGIRRRLHGRAGQREGARARLALALRLLLRLRLGRGRLLLGEDARLVLACKEPLELVAVDRLALDQDLRDAVQLLHVLAEHRERELVRLLDHAPDLVVDLAGDLLGVVGLGAVVTAEERLVVAAAEHARTELLAHAEAHDHLLRHRRDLLEVVRGAGRDLVEDDLLRRAAAERHRHLVHERTARGEVPVLGRQRDREAERLAAGDDRDLVDRVGVLEVVADERVAHLVVGRDLALVLREEPRLLLRAGHDAHDPLLQLLLLDDLLAAPRREQRRLVDEVREVGAGEAGRAGGERTEIDLGCEGLALRVHLEDPLAGDRVGPVDDDLPVEAAGAQERRVEDVGTVGGGDEDDVVLHLEAVHLDEQLVQRLLALVVAAAETGATVAADGVDLVHEDDARRRLLRLLEQVAHTGRADADEHLDEVRARDTEERNAGLARDRAREQRLTGAGRPVEQDALRDARAERLELLRVLEELLDLLELLDRLVHAGDVLETDLRRVGRHPLRARLAEAHHLRAAALHLAHEEDPEAEQEYERQEAAEDRPPRRRAGALRVVLHVRLLELVPEEDRVLVGRVVDGDLLAVREIERERALVRVEVRRLHRLRRLDDDVLDLRERRLLGLVPVARQRLHRQPDKGCDDDQREESATKEPIQRASGRRVPAKGAFEARRPGRSGPDPARPHRAGFGTARRSRGRSRSRTGSGSRSRRSAPGRRSRAAPASSGGRRSRATRARAPPGSASGTRA